MASSSLLPRAHACNVRSSPGFAEVDRAIFSGLENSPYHIELYQESLQLTFFPDEASQRPFRESLIQKYSKRKPDVIIAVGSASLKFIAQSRETFVRETPIVFCGVLGEIPAQLKSKMHFTGVLGRLQPADTLQAALHLLPGTKHVVVVGGMGKFEHLFRSARKKIPQVRFIPDFVGMDTASIARGHLPNVICPIGNISRFSGVAGFIA